VLVIDVIEHAPARLNIPHGLPRLVLLIVAPKRAHADIHEELDVGVAHGTPGNHLGEQHACVAFSHAFGDRLHHCPAHTAREVKLREYVYWFDPVGMASMLKFAHAVRPNSESVVCLFSKPMNLLTILCSVGARRAGAEKHVVDRADEDPAIHVAVLGIADICLLYERHLARVDEIAAGGVHADDDILTPQRR
jgi:hypothetical protein